VPQISPCLWFDGQAQEAAELYVSLFPDSEITLVVPNGEGGPGPADAAMTVAFTLDGQPFLALNGGPLFQFSEAVSFIVPCRTQAEIDHYWDGLIAGGGEEGRCGWLKDRFGVSWQIVPDDMDELMAEPARAQRVMAAFMPMSRLDVEAIRAAAGAEA
jgi:predicted 3-demethylubiquinone-9 3-methyltransferase (glyoxalase superfamily)